MRETTLLSREDVQKVVSAATRSRDRLLVLLFYSRMTVEEVLRLRHGDIDTQTNVIRVPVRDEERIHRLRLHPKRRVTRAYEIALTPEMRKAYEIYLQQEYPFPQVDGDEHVFVSLWKGTWRGMPVRGKPMSYESVKSIFIHLSSVTGIFVRTVLLHRSYQLHRAQDRKKREDQTLSSISGDHVEGSVIPPVIPTRKQAAAQFDEGQFQDEKPLRIVVTRSLRLEDLYLTKEGSIPYIDCYTVVSAPLFHIS